MPGSTKRFEHVAPDFRLGLLIGQGPESKSPADDDLVVNIAVSTRLRRCDLNGVANPAPGHDRGPDPRDLSLHMQPYYVDEGLPPIAHTGNRKRFSPSSLSAGRQIGGLLLGSRIVQNVTAPVAEISMIYSASSPGTCRLSNQAAMSGAVPLKIAEQMA